MPFSLTSLYNLLCEFEIPIRLWGQERAKTIEDLYKEVMRGESMLEVFGDKILRKTKSVRMWVRDSMRRNGYLLEFGKHFSDGRYRERKQLPAQKIMGAELPNDALVRVISEKLHLEKTHYESFCDYCASGTAESRSYPGLTTHYSIHNFKVSLNVPDDSLLTKDTFEIVEADGTRQVFKWQ